MASFPECIVCKEPFRWKSPDPYLLPCLHTVCDSCLKSTVTSIHCNVCQRDFDLKETTLQKDKVTQRLILHLTKTDRPTELLCTHEDDGNQAVCWCRECEEFLCEHCQNLHESFKAMKNHAVHGISETGFTDEEEDSYCTIHKKYVLEIMDHDCGVLICFKCKHGEHAGHSTEDMATLTKTSREELQSHVKALSELKRNSEIQLDENNQHAIQLDEAATSQRDKISHMFDTLRGLVNQREKEIVLEFETHLDRAKSTTADRRSALSLHYGVSSNTLEYAQRVLDHASCSDLTRINAIIRDAVRDCLSSDLHSMKLEHPTVSVLTDYLPDVKSAISTYSGISRDNGKASTKQSTTYLGSQQKCEVAELDGATQRQTISTLQTSQFTEETKTASTLADSVLRAAFKNQEPCGNKGAPGLCVINPPAYCQPVSTGPTWCPGNCDAVCMVCEK